MYRIFAIGVPFFLLSILAGCTIHPSGERAERIAAIEAGKPYETAIEQRQPTTLPADPTVDDLANFALLNNGQLEQQFWQWRAAIEQVVRDGTQPTNLVLSAAATASHGSFAWDRTTFTLSNDPMADIVWPSKLSAAAERSLQEATAIGARFRKSRNELRRDVFDAASEVALAQELLRLEQANLQLLGTIADLVESRLRSGASSQRELLVAQTDLETSRNQVQYLESQIEQKQLALNMAMGRRPADPLPSELEVASRNPLNPDSQTLLAMAAQKNLELAAASHEIDARKFDLQLAKLGYVPDFALNISADPAGVAQSLGAMVTIPLLRHEAIKAAISQADANLRAAKASRKQLESDVTGRLSIDLIAIHDAQRQRNLLENSIEPRAVRSVELARGEYEIGRATIIDLLNLQRALIDLKRLAAHLHATEAQQSADIESIIGKAWTSP